MAMSPRLLRPRASAGYGLDARDWQSRVIANGGTVSATTMKAVDTFCKTIVTAGLRDRFYRLNLFAGSNLSAALVPLFRGPSLGGTQTGNVTDTNVGPFVSGDYTETGATGGLKGNGSSKYLNTGVQTAGLPVPGVGHLSAWGRNQTSSRSGWIGATGAGFTNFSYIEYNHTDGNTFRAWGREQLLSSTPGSLKHLLVTRGSSTDQRAYDEGVLSNTNTTSTTMAGAAFDITVFARNQGGSIAAYSDGRLNAYSIGDNMSGSQVTSFYNALNTFLSSLSRT